MGGCIRFDHVVTSASIENNLNVKSEVKRINNTPKESSQINTFILDRVLDFNSKEEDNRLKDFEEWDGKNLGFIKVIAIWVKVLNE